MPTDLENKLKTINKPKVESYAKGEAKTIKEFWDKFVSPQLPKDKSEIDVYKRWFRLLLEYSKEEDSVFAIRCFSTPCGGSKNYITLRRGFLTKTNHKYSFFYTDNYFSAYFLKMARDGFCPSSLKEFKDCMLSRKFPARFGPYDSKYEKKKAAYIIDGKDPGFATNGYKIAHIIDTGMNYKVGKEKLGLADICAKYFPRGDYDQWNLESDCYGDYYVRRLDCSDNEARNLLKSHFLRFACPLNYILTPKKSCHVCHKRGISDIAEYPAFQQYARERFLDLFGSDYQDYLDELDIYELDRIDNPGDIEIDIEYDLMMSGSDEFSDYARFIVDRCGKSHGTASSYKNSVRKIMKQLHISSPDELEKRIDDAIDYCEKQKEYYKNIGDKNERKNYNNYTSALKKYKEYLSSL